MHDWKPWLGASSFLKATDSTKQGLWFLKSQLISDFNLIEEKLKNKDKICSKIIWHVVIWRIHWIVKLFKKIDINSKQFTNFLTVNMHDWKPLLGASSFLKAMDSTKKGLWFLKSHLISDFNLLEEKLKNKDKICTYGQKIILIKTHNELST